MAIETNWDRVGISEAFPNGKGEHGREEDKGSVGFLSDHVGSLADPSLHRPSSLNVGQANKVIKFSITLDFLKLLAMYF